jgi:hypothetical protein
MNYPYEVCLNYVAIINNPLVALVVRLYFIDRKIDPSRVLLISERNTSLDIFDERCPRTFLGTDGLTAEKRLFITRQVQDKKFVLITPWVLEVADYLGRKQNCFGFIYCEEGRMAYFKSKPYSDRIVVPWKLRKLIVERTKNVNYLFKKNPLLLISIGQEAFKDIFPCEPLHVVPASLIPLIYEPKIKSYENILLTPSVRYVNQISALFRFAAEKIVNLAAIKIHPSLESKREMIKYELEKCFAIRSAIPELIERNVVLEGEMFFDKKIIYGMASSIEIYANLFGSKYVQLSIEEIGKS